MCMEMLGVDALLCCQAGRSDGSVITFSRRVAADGGESRERRQRCSAKEEEELDFCRFQGGRWEGIVFWLLLGSAACGLNQKAICLSSQEVRMLAVRGVVMVT